MKIEKVKDKVENISIEEVEKDKDYKAIYLNCEIVFKMIEIYDLKTEGMKKVFIANDESGEMFFISLEHTKKLHNIREIGD